MIRHAAHEIRENPGVALLAGAGAAQGVYKHCLPQFKAGRAWQALALGVVAYDLLSPRGETLSEGVDRALESHPFLTTAAVGYTALHLLNVVPSKYDPFSLVYDIFK